MDQNECIFCKIARKEIKSDFVYESNSFIVIKDIHPVTPEHILVIPKSHYVTLLDIPARLGEELLDVLKKVSSLILDKKHGNGFNIVMNNLAPAGQIVQHAHIHIIPRNEGDGLKMIV
jgi:histidine triad (HIT) family protein